MRISLDTNVWIFGLIEENEYCHKILLKLSLFQVIVPAYTMQTFTALLYWEDDVWVAECPEVGTVRC